MDYIRPSSDLRNHYSDVSASCRESREPVYITVNGREDTVIMNSHAFREMQARLELYDMLSAAQEDVRMGRVDDAQTTFDALREELKHRWPK